MELMKEADKREISKLWKEGGDRGEVGQPKGGDTDRRKVD